MGSAITAGTEVAETVTETEPMDIEGTEGSNTSPSQTRKAQAPTKEKRKLSSEVNALPMRLATTVSDMRVPFIIATYGKVDSHGCRMSLIQAVLE